MVFNDTDMKLARQKDERTKAQQRVDEEPGGMDAERKCVRNIVRFLRLLDQVTDAAEKVERCKQANRQKCNQLDDRLRRHRQHQAVMMFGGVRIARAEQDSEQSQQNGDEEGRVDW